MSTSVVLERSRTDSGPLSQQATERKRVYILPTAQGLLYGVMLIVMLLGAINYNNSMAFMLCFLLASLAIVCMLHTYRNLNGLVVTTNNAAPVFAGQQSIFPLLVYNPEQRDRFSLSISQQKHIRQFFRRSDITAEVTCSPIMQKHTSVDFPLETKQRGHIRLGKLKIESRFPLGIFTAWSYLETNETGLVYPTATGKTQLPRATVTGEEDKTGLMSGSDDFSGFRKYQPGDAVNSIVWKAYAREQGLLIKQFSGKGSEKLIFSWEQVMDLATIEARLSQLCLWILIADKASIRYGLNIPGVSINESMGREHQHRCLEQLATFGTAHA